MGLYKRKDSPYWWISFTVEGQLHRMCTKTKDRRLAEAIYGKIMTKIIEKKWFDIDPANDYTFDEMMDRFMKEHAPKREKSTYQRYICALKHLKCFSGLRLNEITPDRISTYMHQRKNEGASNATINREFAMLSKAFNLALKEWEWVKENPCSKIQKFPENNLIDRWLTVEEEKALLESAKNYLNGNLKEIIIFALNTGMRQGEIMNLKWEDVDLDRRVIIVKRTKTKVPRTVPMNNTVVELLLSKAVNKTNTEYVFSTTKDTKIGIRNMLREFYKALKKADIKNFRFHDLRHTFATRLVQAGIDIYTVSKLLGHSQVTTAQRYAHHSPESLRPSVLMLDDINVSKLDKVGQYE